MSCLAHALDAAESTDYRGADGESYEATADVPRSGTRSERRFPVNQPARLYTSGASEAVWVAYILDISRRGMQLVVDRPVLEGPNVHIEWHSRTISGTIRYQRQHGADYRLGVELSESWESLMGDMLAYQTEELRASNAALTRTQAELKRKNEELQMALDGARRASEIKSRFLASVSHELRTPLNCIVGFSQLLHDSVIGPITSDQKDCLSDILKSSNHLLALINDVLDLTKIESGKMVFHLENLRLDEVVREVVETIRPIAVAKNITLESHVEQTLPAVQADAARLKQVLYNYLSNAMKFTPNGGKIVVRVVRETAASYRVQVEDNGIGIEADDIPRLFTEFGQLGPSQKAKSGTGLGLAITKRIVEAQGGCVGVGSVFGKGCKFYAILPM